MSTLSTGPHPLRAPARRWFRVGAVALGCLLPLLAPAAAPAIHLKLGDIEGESMVRGHEDEIEILSWAWGGSRDASSTRYDALPDIGPVVLIKEIDKSSPAILLNCFEGRHIDRAILTVSQDGRDGPLDILSIELEDVMVTSYDVEGDDLEVHPVEQFELNFDSITSIYTLFGSDGTEEGSSQVYWTVSTNTGGGDGSSGGSGGGGEGPPPNVAPGISSISDQTIDEDGSVLVSFTVSDPETPAGSLTLGRSSSNQALLPLGNIVFGGSGSNRSATLTPAANQSGSSSVLLTVSDGSRTDSASFVFTVNPVNDPPGLGPLGARTTEIDLPLDLDVPVADIDSSIDTVTLAGTANPPGLVTSIADTSLSGSIRSVTIVPAPGATGTTTITLTATDDALPVAGQAQTSFLLTINPPAGAGPSAILLNGLDATNPVAVDENAPNGTELGLLEALDDPGIEHEFTLLDNAGGRFAIGGPDNKHLVVANSALLDFEDLPTHVVVIQASDVSDSLHARSDSFLVEVRNVNEPPAITVSPDLGLTPPDTDFGLEGLLIDDPDSGSADIVATFAVANGILMIDESGPLAGKTLGNASNTLVVTAPVADLRACLATPFGLLYRSDPSFTGTETLTVTTDDGGNTGPGGPQGDLASATLEVAFTPWELWRRAQFTPAELLDPNISSFAADPDRDGLANGGEYGVGSLPKDGTSGPDRIQLVAVEFGGESYPALLFPRRISDPHFTLELEVATDLLSWASGLAYTFEESATPIDADFDQPAIRSLFPVSLNPAQQLRLRIMLKPP